MTVCSWAFGEKENMQVYHAKEWGKETHDERLLFEMLSLELMQAGLSWQTVLDKRQAFKDDFCDFDTEKIGQLTSDEINQIIQDPRIIRNKRKIDAIINNAKIVEQWHKQGNSLDDFFWSYVGHHPLVSHWHHAEEVPASSFLSQQISRDLKKMSFQFVGPTIIYSFLQAIGVVNDHIETCENKYF
ncbi:DNA-3-methyladenine glycosylase I [Ligilactobacillus acidipiscis]|uniref:DNA-3-methyladenine glycosylase I n=1 Tax=Ligilactobacillus acidipiscis TaxID=89059 RepID=UPI00386677B4